MTIDSKIAPARQAQTGANLGPSTPADHAEHRAITAFARYASLRRRIRLNPKLAESSFFRIRCDMAYRRFLAAFAEIPHD